MKKNRFLKMMIIGSTLTGMLAASALPAMAADMKIGVLVADVSGEEAQAFRAYYENYIADQYDVAAAVIAQ